MAIQIFSIDSPTPEITPPFQNEAMAIGWREGYEAAVQALRDQGAVIQFDGKSFPCPECTSMMSLPHYDCET